MRVCITGGSGFLGRALVRRLLSRNCSVRLLVRPSGRADDLQAQGAEVVRGRLQDSESVTRAVKGAHLVYHLAAKAGSSGSRNEFFEANVLGTETVLAACLKESVGRVVYTSSVAVYGSNPPGQHIDEDTPLDAAPQLRDFYAHSKIQADKFTATFARKTGLPITILRPGIIFGPGRPLPIALLAFSLGRSNCIFGSPENRIPLTYVENLIDAMQLVSNPDQQRLETFNVVDDEDLTLEQYHLARAQIEKTRTFFFPGWPVLFTARLAGVWTRVLPLGGALSLSQVNRALQDRCYDTRRIREKMGWNPNTTLSEAIERTLRG